MNVAVIPNSHVNATSVKFLIFIMSPPYRGFMTNICTQCARSVSGVTRRCACIDEAAGLVFHVLGCH